MSSDVPPAAEKPLRRRMLESPHAAWITHLSLFLLTVALFSLLLSVKLVYALVPCVLVDHRIGILLHEYIHGIPFRRARHNRLVLTVFDGIMMTFGLLELFRGTHLAHHKHLNTERDPAWKSSRDLAARPGFAGLLAALELPQHVSYLRESLSGRARYVDRTRLLASAALSLLAVGLWIALGHREIPPIVIGLSVYNALVSSSLRGAVEHHAEPGEAGSVNEYRSFLPIFNINRHIHHHEAPSCPWYLLEFRTRAPLPASAFLGHWIQVYVKRRYVLMRPAGGSRG